MRLNIIAAIIWWFEQTEIKRSHNRNDFQKNNATSSDNIIQRIMSHSQSKAMIENELNYLIAKATNIFIYQ